MRCEVAPGKVEEATPGHWVDSRRGWFVNPSVFIAISNHRIVSVKDNSVSFHYKDYKTKAENGLPPVKTLTLSARDCSKKCVKVRIAKMNFAHDKN